LKVRVDKTKAPGVKLGTAVAVKTRPTGTEVSEIVTGVLTPGKPLRLVMLATAVAVAPGATTNKFGLIARPKSQILICMVKGDLNVLVRPVTLSLALKLPKIVTP
jgi:hypothetical protein